MSKTVLIARPPSLIVVAMLSFGQARPAPERRAAAARLIQRHFR